MEIRSRSKICLSRDKLLAQNFDPVLAVIVKLAGDTIMQSFAMMRYHTFLDTPDEYTNMGCGWDGLVWVEMDGDGWG